MKGVRQAENGFEGERVEQRKPEWRTALKGAGIFMKVLKYYPEILWPDIKKGEEEEEEELHEKE